MDMNHHRNTLDIDPLKRIKKRAKTKQRNELQLVSSRQGKYVGYVYLCVGFNIYYTSMNTVNGRYLDA